MKPHRDTVARNRIFFITLIAAIAVGAWLVR